MGVKLWVAADILIAPIAQLSEYAQQCFTIVRQLIFHPHRYFIILIPADNPILLQLLERL